MPRLTWSDDFSVGIEEFDNHHRHLINLINDTRACFEQHGAHGDLRSILESLVDYAWYHFSAEEKFMLASGFSGYEEHLQQHRAFSARIIELKHQLGDDNPAVAWELLSFLDFWLIDHIVISDIKYAEHTGRRAAPVLMS